MESTDFPAIRHSFASQGFLKGMGARLTDLRQGHCIIEMPFSDTVSQQHGFFHGGAVGALADSAGGYAAMTVVADDTDVVTLEYKINFLRPASGDRLGAEATMLRAGRSVVVTRIDVWVIDDHRRMHCAAIQQSIMPAPRQRVRA